MPYINFLGKIFSEEKKSLILVIFSRYFSKSIHSLKAGIRVLHICQVGLVLVDHLIIISTVIIRWVTNFFHFFYCYDVINSIFYKTNSYSEIRNWSITLKGLLYIHIQINFVTRVPLDFIQFTKRHQVSPPEVSTLFRPWCNTKQNPFLT